jgi:isopenicillin N synthase-like dioxygenase
MPKVDPTWRYHWLLGSDQNIIPSDFPDFAQNFEDWGRELLQTNITVCEMTAIALGLERDAISKTIANGANYLSPPGMDLSKSKIGDVITGFHRDFGLITAHAPTRFEGMYAWLLTGEKVSVAIPENHLLIQGGKQLEWLTGGYLKAGFHEVIHNRKVENQVKENLKSGRSNWRVVNGLFSYVQGNLRLKPFAPFNTETT